MNELEILKMNPVEVRDRFRGKFRGDDVTKPEDVTTSIMKEQTQKIDGKEFQFTFVKDGRYLGGLTEKYIMKDQHGDLWLFKVNDKPGENDWAGEGEVAANKLLKALGLFSVDIANVTFDNIASRDHVSGTLQKMIHLKFRDLAGIRPNQLTKKNWEQLQQHHIIDYLLDNPDWNEGNFAINDNDDIVALDKGETLRSFIDPITFTPDFSKLSSEYLGELIPWRRMDFMSVKPLIEKIENLPDSKLRDMFKVCAKKYEKQTGHPAKEILNFLIERKHTIRQTVENFYKELAHEKGI